MTKFNKDKILFKDYIQTTCTSPISRPWQKHVQSFKKIGTKLYEELHSQGTHCLYTFVESEVRKWQKLKKWQKLMQRLYPNHMHIFRPWRIYVRSFKKIGIKLYEELSSQGTHCLYTEVEKWHKVENVTKNNLRIISKPHAHPLTMKKTPAKFQKDRYKTIRGVELTRHPG